MGLMAALLVGMVVVTQAANLRQAVKAYLFGFPLVIMDLTREPTWRAPASQTP